jgi:hypothetical protein
VNTDEAAVANSSEFVDAPIRCFNGHRDGALSVVNSLCFTSMFRQDGAQRLVRERGGRERSPASEDFFTAKNSPMSMPSELSRGRFATRLSISSDRQLIL